MGLKARLEAEAARARAAVRDVASSAVENEFPGLRALLADPDESESAERLLLRLVRSVRDDEPGGLWSQEAIGDRAKRRRRHLGLLSFGTGPLVGVASQAVDLYCDVATLHDVAALHRLALTDEQMAAHVLVLWSITPTMAEGEAAIAGTDGRSVEDALGAALTREANERLPERWTPWSVIKAMWQMRSLIDDVREGGKSGVVKPVVFTGRHTKRVIERVERQLAVSGDDLPAIFSDP